MLESVLVLGTGALLISVACAAAVRHAIAFGGVVALLDWHAAVGTVAALDGIDGHKILL